jgi:hypothetical protein
MLIARSTQTLLFVALIACALPLRAADEIRSVPAVPENKSPEEQDLAAMQGRWTYSTTNQAGAVFRIEKVVKSTDDVVTHYDQNGNVIHAHTSTFDLTRHGPLRVFTIRNTLATAGPNTGQNQAGPRSYAYRVEGDNFLEVWGLLETDRGPPRVIIWTRVKDGK